MNTIKKEIKKDRLGESNIAKNGQVMTVIGYRKHTDIDIQFEDGTIVKNKSYYNFKYGNIKNPNIKENRTGEINIANNGQSMTIIEYRKCTDIDVQFEDGTIVKNKSYINFKIGNIGNPNYVISGISYNELFCLEQLKQFGFRKAEKGELKGVELGSKELDLYNPELKIGIEYDGGAYTKEIKYHTIKRDIEKDLLCEKAGITLYRIRESQLPRYNSPSIKYYLKDNSRNSQNLIDIICLIVKDINLKFNTNFKYKYKIKKIKLEKIQSRIKRKRVGETNIATNGQVITIIKYRNTNDIDVQFEDGTIVKHKSYYNFKKGRIKNSKLAIIQLENKIGENSIAKNGQTMTIIEYRKYKDIDIQFEDGTIVKGVRYNQFKLGNISNSNLPTLRLKDKTGETNIANNGQTMTIIEYRSNNDIDIQFEDGTIVKHKSYTCFKKGMIKNFDNILKNRLGESNIANNGQTMTIIEYRKYNDIDIQFEDGTIVKHKSYSKFKEGKIKNPNYIQNRLGESNIANNEQTMTIIEYRNFNDIDVQFEDGTIVKNKSYHNFLIGNIGNPNLKNIQIKNRVGESNIAKNGQSMTIIKYKSSYNIDIQLEDGTIVRNKSYSNFKKGLIKNPNYKKKVS